MRLLRNCPTLAPLPLRSLSVPTPFFLRFLGTEEERSKSGEEQENEGNKMGDAQEDVW